MKSKVQMRPQILVVHNELIYFVNRPWIINHKTKLFFFFFETCIMTLVSFSCCELHRGITTYSQLVATGYSQERKNPRAARGKRLLKPCYTCSFTVRHLLMATVGKAVLA